ncbi:hypothetical protein ACTXG5_10265 [Mycobacterium sp. Dal123C01]|uniref:hypothetical protein n=1 Tax=Mycobacterium sp. Dal123C01 TaxID=3457577 RepID=UPI00403EE203
MTASSQVRETSTRETPFGFVIFGFEMFGRVFCLGQWRVGGTVSALTYLGDGVHRAVLTALRGADSRRHDHRNCHRHENNRECGWQTTKTIVGLSFGHPDLIRFGLFR